jgi:predicted transcriptional regulator
MLLDYLKVVLSWPPMALVIVLVFFYRFKLAIEGLLGRVTEGEIFGQKIKAAAPSQSLESSSTDEYLTNIVESHPNADTQPIASVSEPLPDELADDPHAQIAIEWVKNNPIQTVIEYKKLMLHLGFERAFNMMYGTQISLLEFLALRPTDSISITQLSKFHMEHLSKVMGSNYQRQNYMNFLVINDLIREAPIADQQGYSITSHGIQFLAYIKATYPLGWFQRLY